MPDIFLSYTREDQATAQRFAQAFESQGFAVWWDVTLRSGEAYDQVTEEALRTAKAVVVLWSTKSVVSRWVRAEATLADRNRTLLPAMIEPCERPIMFELTQTADLSRWQGDGGDPVWCGFLADVSRFVEKSTEPTQAAARRAPPAGAAPAARSQRPSIAVLPFINRSGREADDEFADAMVEDLTAALSASTWMNVLAPRATAAYRHAAVDLRQIGRDLGVRYFLEGNVRRLGENFRVTAQLVEAESGNILWAQRFDRPLAELSAFQEDLVTDLATHLGVQLYRVELDHALKTPASASAWDAFMRSNAHSRDATQTGWEAAATDAQRAVDIAPHDGVAYAALAIAQGQLWRLRGGGDPELAQDIARAVRRARALAPDDPVVLCYVAWALACLRNLQDALRLAERAAALPHNQENTHLVLGGILARLGRSEEALTALDTAERRAPNSPTHYYLLIWRALAQLRADRVEKAIEASDRAVDIQPGAEALLLSMLCWVRMNRWDCARDTLNRLREADATISRAVVESLVRDFYGGTDRVDDYVAVACTVWDEAVSAPKSSA
jgi:TolB-like protein